MLRRDGLLDAIWCLDPDETLSPGQAGEITRVERSYVALTDAGLHGDAASHRPSNDSVPSL